jgi:uncharacterized membrane protein YkvA (DUF1232 family)
MSADAIKISFTLDKSDIAHFRKLLREARQQATPEQRPAVVAGVRRLIHEVRRTKKVPSFVSETIDALEDLIEMLDDEDYALPKATAARALVALAYFANPSDLIPDHIPGLGFLDDAIMIKIVEEEFRHELWGYRKFRKFREGAEQRPWTAVARKRLPERLKAYRKELRAKIDAKNAAMAPRSVGW